MKLKELKCKNCGATLEVEDNVQKVKCKFCHTTFAVEDAYTDGYKYEKGRLQAQNEQFEKNMEHVTNFFNNNPIGKAHKRQSIIFSIFFGIIFCGVIVGIIVGITSSISADKEFDIKRFNNSYEIHVGTERGFGIRNLIDEITTNNKTNDKHKVTLKYNDIETQDPEEMKNIKKQLDDWKDYEVSFEYDKDGYIYLATIEE